MNDRPISADSHVVEAPEVFAGLAARFGDDAPRIVHLEGTADAMVIPSRAMRGTGAGRVGIAGSRLRPDRKIVRAPGHKPEPEEPTDPVVRRLFGAGYAGLRRGIVDPSERAQDQDLDGVAAEVLYPSFYFGVFGLSDPDLIVACFKNYNDWLWDYCSRGGGRLIGLALIPLQSPEAARDELDRVIAMGYRGGCIPCSAPADHPYGDPVYDPIWERAQAARFPLHMHIGTTSHPGTRPGPRPRSGGTTDAISSYASAASTIQRTLTDLICRGVAHRFPELRFVAAEWDAGWIANWLERLDQGIGRARHRAYPGLDRRPSEYFRRQFYATFEDDRAAVLTRDLIGVENLLWCSDYPHRDSTWPCSMQVLDEVLEGVSAADRARLTIHNARALYGL